MPICHTHEETTRGFRWLFDAGTPDVDGELSKLEGYLNQYHGLKALMFDCACLLASRMISSQPVGSPTVTYKFYDKLKIIYNTRKMDRRNAETRVIDLTEDGLSRV